MAIGRRFRPPRLLLAPRPVDQGSTISRVLQQDAAFKDLNSWERVYARTRATTASTEKFQNLARWNTWYRSNFLQQLMLNRGEVEGTLGTLEQILSATKGTNAVQTRSADQVSNSKKRHQSCQGCVYKGLVAASLQDPVTDLEQRCPDGRCICRRKTITSQAM